MADALLVVTQLATTDTETSSTQFDRHTDHRHNQRAHVKEAICDKLAFLVVHAWKLFSGRPEQRHPFFWTVDIDSHHAAGYVRSRWAVCFTDRLSAQLLPAQQVLEIYCQLQAKHRHAPQTATDRVWLLAAGEAQPRA